MKRIVFLLLFLPLFLHSQQFQPLTQGDLPNMQIAGTDSFDIQSLQNYYTDPSLYMEYGFSGLVVQRLMIGYENFKLEVFRMNTSEAAFGLFSLQAAKCPYRDSINVHDCLGGSGYQAAHGNLFISVSGGSGSRADAGLFIAIANAVIKKNPRSELQLPDPFNNPFFKMNRNTLVFISGNTGIQNSFFPWTKLFFVVNFSMYAISLPFTQSIVYFARISFATPQDQTRFMQAAGLMKNNVRVVSATNYDGLYVEYRQVDAQTIYFLQCQQPSQAFPIDAVLNMR
jgi:hypothetical protein